ncbi:MAG: hypothetical protein ACREMT_08845, partial [Vulcanimicrobiaceae bacterium]
LSIGSAPERYLEATLTAIAPVVDLLVVNDNAAGSNPNLPILEASDIARAGRLRVVRTAFVDFGTMRNDAFSALAATAKPDWVLWLDADEVHYETIAGLARHLLPRLGPDYAAVHCYKIHLVGSFRWVSDAARAVCAYRFNPALRWRGAVHEQLENVSGKAVVVPHRIAHYGAVLPPAAYATKARKYAELGQAIDNAYPAPSDANVENVYARKAKTARRFTGSHPDVAYPTIDRLEREWAEYLAEADRLFEGMQTPLDRATNGLRAAVEETRIALRYVEHPGLWPPRPFPNGSSS